jgi:putative endonuclease
MRREKFFYVYILSNYSRQVIYTGVTNNIIRRVIEHKNGIGSEFTAKYNLKYLIFFERWGSAEAAIFREKEIKAWRRSKKIALIRGLNPQMLDLSEQLFKDFDLSETDILGFSEELKSLRQADSSVASLPRNDE